MNDNWMEIFLANNGFLVSGTRSFAGCLGLNEEMRTSLRLVAWFDSYVRREIFLLVVENIQLEDASRIYKKLKNNCIYDALEKLLQQNIYVLLTLSDGQFFLENRKSPHELAEWFYSKSRALNQDIGTTKDTNRRDGQRKSDFFYDFTRNHLSRFCVCTDIDAVRLPSSQNQRLLFLELKTPEERVTTWQPYIDDCANYMHLQDIAQKINAEFRVIAYNLSCSTQVQLILDVHCDQPSRSARMIRYKSVVVSPSEAIGDITLESLECKVSSRKRQTW